MSDDIEIIKHMFLRLSRCPLCPYPEKDDKERVLLRVINPENNKKAYAVKCPNIIASNGQPCINLNFSAVRTVKYGEISQRFSKEVLEDLYINQGKSLQDIADEFRCTRTMIQLLMKKYGVERRNRSRARLLAIKERKFKAFYHDDINEDFFSNWSPEMAWVLGLIFTDGCLSGGRVQICSIDLDLLDKVKSLLNSNKPIQKAIQSQDKTKFIYRFEFYREKMRKDLDKLGLIQRKSLILKFPDVPKEHIRHFVRGCWDGDGSVFISAGKLRASYVSGSKDFIYSLIEKLYRMGIGRKSDLNNKHLLSPLKIHIDKRTKSTIYSIKVDSEESLIKLFSYFYYDVDEAVYLKRKYDVFAGALNMPPKNFEEFTAYGSLNIPAPLSHKPSTSKPSNKRYLQINNNGKLQCSKCKAINKLMYVSSDTLCWECLQNLKSRE